MKDFITPDIIDKCIDIVKKGEYDFDKFTIPVAENAPCSLTQAWFPVIIDMALQNLKRNARVTPLDVFCEWGTEKPTRPADNIIPIPIFQSRKEQFS